MTIGEFREAARIALTEAGPDAVAPSAAYEVEIQKKFALAAASMVLALVGASIGLRFDRGGIVVVIGASATVFVAY